MVPSSPLVTAGGRVLEGRAHARRRVPVVALHLAVLRGDGRYVQTERRGRVAPQGAVRRRVGVARSPVRALRALRVGDPRVGGQRRGLAGARSLDPRLGRGLPGGVLEAEIGHLPDQRSRVGQAGVWILGRRAGEARRLLDDALERLAGEIGGGRGGGGAAHEDTEREPLLPRVGHGLDLAEADRRAPVAVPDEIAARRGRAETGGARQRRDQQVRVHGSGAVPPTVMSSMRIVGSPTPTGTDCPSLPQVPTPSSRARSRPTRVTRVSASGPAPMRDAPLTGTVTRPSSISQASFAEKTNLPFVMST